MKTVDIKISKLKTAEYNPRKISDKELGNLKRSLDKFGEEMLEKIPAKAKKGDIYQLGYHRLMCGDSTSLDDIMKLTEGKKMDMVWTDPPYNMSEASFREFYRDVFVNLVAVTRQGGVFYVCTGWQSFATFEDTLTDWLVMKALKNSTKFKDNVIDLFGGSGSCLMACEKLGRNAFLMELDPRFIDVIIYRWEKYTGKKAEKL